MSATNQDLIRQARKEMTEYRLLNFGLIFGADFPAIAQMLVNLDEFTSSSFLSLAMSILTSNDAMARVKASGKEIPGLREALRGSHHEQMLLEFFYWGYRVGKQCSEVEALNNLAEKS